MALADFFEAVESRRGSITVYAAEEPEWVAYQFESRNVAVEFESLPPDAPTGFVVIREGGEFVASIGLAELREVMAPPIRRPWRPPPPDSGYRALLSLLEDTIFTAFGRRQLLGAAREIEDRAWRVGRGRLHVGFQRLSAMRDQYPVYARLGEETDLIVDVYGRDDWEPPAIPNATVHAESAPEIGNFWFLAFDGGPDRSNACALLAEERDHDEFYGFWTYDAGMVGELIAYLEATYG